MDHINWDFMGYFMGFHGIIGSYQLLLAIIFLIFSILPRINYLQWFMDHIKPGSKKVPNGCVSGGGGYHFSVSDDMTLLGVPYPPVVNKLWLTWIRGWTLPKSFQLAFHGDSTAIYSDRHCLVLKCRGMELAPNQPDFDCFLPAKHSIRLHGIEILETIFWVCLLKPMVTWGSFILRSVILRSFKISPKA